MIFGAKNHFALLILETSERSELRLCNLTKPTYKLSLVRLGWIRLGYLGVYSFQSVKIVNGKLEKTSFDFLALILFGKCENFEIVFG